MIQEGLEFILINVRVILERVSIPVQFWIFVFIWRCVQIDLKTKHCPTFRDPEPANNFKAGEKEITYKDFIREFLWVN